MPDQLAESPYAPPPPPSWLEGKVSGPEHRIRYLNSKKQLIWQSNPGPQTWALLCPYDEILLGGSRGGGKSAGLIAWMATGDNSLAEDDPARPTFLNDPDFRGLLLREEYQSMAEFVDESVEFYRTFGGKPGGNPVVVDFTPKNCRHGAKIYFNHLGDEWSFNKYRGWNLTRIGAEELTQISTKARYMKLFGSLRSVERVRNGKRYPKLRTQMLSTTNPDGPGAMWVKERFIEVYGKNGQLVPWNTPMRDTISGKTRIFIPARIEDNPFLRDDKQYMGNLLLQDEVTQAQWIHGDWNATGGLYFREWRPDGPRGKKESEETPWARHIPADEPNLQSWWYRWGSGDWGFSHNAVNHKFCRNERDGRIHVYDELSVRQVGSFELGVMLAKWWLPDLEMLPDKQITMYFSPDAFSKTDANRTKAEQMADGIKEVLGPYGAFLLKYSDDERAAMARDPKAAALMFERRRQESARGQMCITLKPANNDRVGGWSYLHELLRFRPVLTETEEEIKQDLRRKFEQRGIEAYEQSLSKYKERKPEILPKLQLWRRCKLADYFMRTAIHDEPPRAEDVRKFDAEDGVGGDDGGDSLRYGVMGYKSVETTVPKSYWINERMTQIQETTKAAFGEQITDINRLMQIQRTQASLYDKQHTGSGGSITLPRAASMRHRTQ